MKKLVNMFNNKRLLVFAGLVAVVYLSDSVAMLYRGSDRAQRAVAARAQARKLRQPGNDILREKAVVQKLGLGGFKSEEQKNVPMIWVQTSGGITSIEKWKIGQMGALNLFLGQQGNSKENPIQAPNLTSEKIVLLSHAFDALANGTFDQYYDDLKKEYDKSIKNINFGEGRLRVLISAAEIVQAKELSALLGAKMLPGDMQKNITSDIFVEPVNVYLKSELLKKAKKIGPSISFNGKLLSFAFNEDNSQCLMGGGSGKLLLLDMENKKTIIFENDQVKNSVCFVGFNKTNDRIVSWHYARYPIGAVILWDAKTGKMIKKLSDKSTEEALSFSPDGKQVLVGVENDVIIFNSETGEEIKKFTDHQSRVQSVAWHPNSNYILSTACGSIRLWDVALKNSNELSSDQYVSDVSWATFSRQGNKILFLSDNSNSAIKMWSFGGLDTCKLGLDTCELGLDKCKLMYNKKYDFLGDLAFLKKAGFSGDDKRFFISSYNVGGEPAFLSAGWVLLGDVETGHYVKILTEGEDVCGAFSPDSTLLAVKSNTYLYNKIKFLDVVTGAELTSIYDPQGSREICFGKNNELFIMRANGIDKWELMSDNDMQTLKAIKNNLDVAQSLLLYQLYLAKEKGLSVLEGFKEQVFTTLPADVQQMVSTYLLPKQNTLKKQLSSVKNYFSSWWSGKSSE